MKTLGLKMLTKYRDLDEVGRQLCGEFSVLTWEDVTLRASSRGSFTTWKIWNKELSFLILKTLLRSSGRRGT